MDSRIEDQNSHRYKPSERRAKWNAYDNAIIRLNGLGRGFFGDRAFARNIDDGAFLGQNIVLFNVPARREGRKTPRLARIQTVESSRYNILSLPRVADPDIPSGDRGVVTLVVFRHICGQLTLLRLVLVLFQLLVNPVNLQRDKRKHTCRTKTKKLVFKFFLSSPRGS